MSDPETIEEYIESLRPLPIAHLEWMAQHIDKEKYSERYKAILDVISDKRSRPEIYQEIALLREKSTVENKYHTFWPRFWAGWIDVLLFVPLSLFANHFIYPIHSVFVVLAWNELHSWGLIAYYVLMHGIKGQTVGKMICKVKVFDKSEGSLSLRQAVLRDIVPIVSNIISSLYLFSDVDKYYKSLTGGIKDFALSPKWMEILLMMVLLWFITEIITMLTNKKRRALHDYIAGSVVCRIG
jgi:uncharacterized RDD family membrane protein YckC